MRKGGEKRAPPTSSARTSSEKRKKVTISSAISTAPSPVQDLSSVIEDSTDLVNSSTVTKRDFSAKEAIFLETSAIPTPGNTPRTGTRVHSDASIGMQPKVSAITLIAKQSAADGKGKGKKKDKPELVSPAEFARRLRLHAPITGPSAETETDPGGHKARRQQVSARLPVKVTAQAPSQYLKDYVIFYAGGDLTYASARTRGCMNYVRCVVPLFCLP